LYAVKVHAISNVTISIYFFVLTIVFSPDLKILHICFLSLDSGIWPCLAVFSVFNGAVLPTSCPYCYFAEVNHFCLSVTSSMVAILIQY